MKLKSYLGAAVLGAGLLIANSANAQTNWVLGGNSPTKTDTLGNKTNQDLKIITNNKVQVTIKKTGWVGIGIAAPVAKLDVLCGTTTKDTLGLRSVIRYAGTATDAVAIYADAATNTAPGYGVGIHSLGNFTGALSVGANYGVIGVSNNVGVDGEAVDNGGDTTDLTGCQGLTIGGDVSVGVYGNATGANNNYGVYGEQVDTAGPNYALVGIGDVFGWRFFQASDRKLKSNIQSLTGALEKVYKLETATYTFDHDKYPGSPLPVGLQIGFMADNIEALFPELIKYGPLPTGATRDARGKVTYHSIPDVKTVNYMGLIPVLAEAIKEQKQIIDQKDLQTSARIAQLENEVAELKAMLTEKKGTVTETGSLLQNVPNPANGNTTISLYLPENSKGVLQIEDAAGKIVKSYKVTGSGMQDVIVNTATLSSGTYTYSLTINGKVADSKTMVISK